MSRTTAEEQQDAADSELLLGNSEDPEVDAWRYNQDDEDEDDFRMEIIPCCMRSCFRKPRTARHWKNISISYVLLFVGLGCLLAGAIVADKSTDSKIALAIFLVVGILCIIPGAYFTLSVCCALRSRSPRALDKLFATFPGSN
eukprot:m.13267 g.13267  ORF g.13267 m.13267 type:complete len:143 (+) comp10131_c0_seq1:130-558(+)